MSAGGETTTLVPHSITLVGAGEDPGSAVPVLAAGF